MTVASFPDPNLHFLSLAIRKAGQFIILQASRSLETKLTLITIKLLTIKYYMLIVLFILQIENPDAEPLKVTQYHFTSWPDHGVPKFATSLIAFIRRVQKGHNKNDGYPLLVHCSAGVGRTGTFILLDSMLERMKKEDTVNVYGFLFNMRTKRTMMVQSQVSYHLYT